MDMHAMIAAAQNHMQKNLTAKMASIGVPMSAFGMATGDGGWGWRLGTAPRMHAL